MPFCSQYKPQLSLVWVKGNYLISQRLPLSPCRSCPFSTEEVTGQLNVGKSVLLWAPGTCHRLGAHPLQG